MKVVKGVYYKKRILLTGNCPECTINIKQDYQGSQMLTIFIYIQEYKKKNNEHFQHRN